MIPVGKMSWREISAMLGSCCSSMLFGLSFMFTKRIVGTVPAFSLLSWRFLMGAAAMSLCALLGVIHIDYKTKKPWPLLRMTLYLPAAYFIFETYGIELTSASESGTIIACIPIFTVLASALFLHEMPSKFQVGGVLLSTVGIVIITLLKGTSPTFKPLGLCAAVRGRVQRRHLFHPQPPADSLYPRGEDLFHVPDGGGVLHRLRLGV